MFNSPFAGVLGLVHLVLFVWALIQILTSSMSAGHKILWTLVVFLFPIIGLLLYIFIGRKA